MAQCAGRLAGAALFTLIGVGTRLLMMVTIQQRRERVNRQINERLRTLIAAYKILGGSFTGDLHVDPAHRRDQRQTQEPPDGPFAAPTAAGSDRARRIRDAVEAALSDVILLGTEPQVRLADRAVRELVAGRPVETHDLVVSLRDFIREALDLAPSPADIIVPRQGPARPSGGGSGRDKGEGARTGSRGEGGGGMGGGGMGGTTGGGMEGSVGLGGETGADQHGYSG